MSADGVLAQNRYRSFANWRHMSALIALAAAVHSITPLPFGNLLVPLLEQRFQRVEVDMISSATGVIALGGGNGERIREAGRLARHFPHLLVIVTGAGLPDDTITSLLGDAISPSRIWLEGLAQNTRGNARFTRELLSARSNDRWVLVTSASHMPRAVGAFRKREMTVLPWPVDDTPEDPASRNRIAVHRWKRAHQTAVAAHRALHAALRSGAIKRADCCEVIGCDSKDVHAHHRNYNRPLLVLSLCALHHEAVHHQGPQALKTGKLARPPQKRRRKRKTESPSEHCNYDHYYADKCC